MSSKVPAARQLGLVAAGLGASHLVGTVEHFLLQSRVWDAGLDPISPAAFFGPRPLTEDGHERSRSTTALVNARLGYRLENGMALRLDAFNLFNTKASQIDYWYASRLTGEPAAGRGFCNGPPVVNSPER